MTWTLISRDPERANEVTIREVEVRVATTHRMWEMTAFLILAGGVLAGGAWWVMSESEGDLLAMLPRQVNALIIQAVIHTNLGAIAVFGLAALCARDPTMLGLYAVLLWNHWVLSLMSGGFLLWAMLQGDPEVGPPTMLNECAMRGLTAVARATCEWNFSRVQNITVGTTAALWIIEFYGCCIASRFVSLASAADAQAYDGPDDPFLWAPQVPDTASTLPPTPRTAQIPNASQTERSTLLVPPTPRSARPPMTPRTPHSAANIAVDMSLMNEEDMEEVKTPLPPVSPRPMRFGWW